MTSSLIVRDVAIYSKTRLSPAPPFSFSFAIEEVLPLIDLGVACSAHDLNGGATPEVKGKLRGTFVYCRLASALPPNVAKVHSTPTVLARQEAVANNSTRILLPYGQTRHAT